MKTAARSCTDHTPPSFVGHWREWHRGHGCDKDDGKPRSDAATTEIVQITENADTGFLTDAELSFLRAATTSGNTLLVRALDELKARRANADTLSLTVDELRMLRTELAFGDTLRVRALDELTTRRANDRSCIA